MMVYNLEIDAEHVYHVGDNGLLVHNDCPELHRMGTSRERMVGSSRPGA